MKPCANPTCREMQDRGKYCSDRCLRMVASRKWRLSHPRQSCEKFCIICGSKISPYKRKYCSIHCQLLSRSKLSKKRRIILGITKPKCRYCNSEIYMRGKITCGSNECKRLRRQEKEIAKRPRERLCRWCNDSFKFVGRELYCLKCKPHYKKIQQRLKYMQNYNPVKPRNSCIICGQPAHRVTCLSSTCIGDWKIITSHKYIYPIMIELFPELKDIKRSKLTRNKIRASIISAGKKLLLGSMGELINAKRPI